MNKILVILLIVILILIPKHKAEAAETTNTEQPTSTVLTSLSEQVTVNLAQSVTNKSSLELVSYNLPTLSPIQVGISHEEETIAAQPKSIKEVAEQIVTNHFGKGQFSAFNSIVTRESNWNPNAVNSQSGACGLGQALPCSKIADHSPVGQINWTVSYIKNRYGTPANAWYFWQLHGWY